MWQERGGQKGGGGEERNAGCCLFKTRTQHHGTVWKTVSGDSSPRRDPAAEGGSGAEWGTTRGQGAEG
eukprot:1035375-Pyramimonas_sp.AAC.1